MRQDSLNPSQALFISWYVHNVRRKNKDRRGPETAFHRSSKHNLVHKISRVPRGHSNCKHQWKIEFPGSTLTFLSCHGCFAYPFFLCNEGLLPSSYLWFKVCQVFWSNYWLVHNLNYPSFVLCFRKVISGERSVQIMIETSKYWNYPLITALQ